MARDIQLVLNFESEVADYMSQTQALDTVYN